MKVSVIIAVYNKARYIKKCLESLSEQTLKNLEIIVVDDGSKDKTQQIIKQLQAKNQQLTILSQKHQGPAIARNLGAKLARGEILLFVDGDMYFNKNFVEDLVFPIKICKAKGTFSTEEFVANWENKWARCWNYNWNLPDKKRIDLKRNDQQKDFRAILKKDFNKVAGFDDVGYTDTWSLQEKLKYRPKATKALYYHYNPASLSEVFRQAKWLAKRKYKLGALGRLVTLFRVNPFFSLLNGLRKVIIKKEAAFIIFKLVYDCGITCGLIECFWRKNKKYA
ncbi:MAG TPA: glycosyltransferase family 2 protein [Candidatus Bathyarchaeia archaeon]|nr:glycosyltransferase family 2 protein [Candidatus Bathyarchaeia archaeon]